MPTKFYADDADAPPPNRPRRLGVQVALIRQDQVLLEQRSDAPRWSFISGGVKDDEAVLPGLLREISEETSAVLLGSPRLVGVYSSPNRIIAYPDGNVSQVVSLAFVCELASDIVRPSSESLRLRFFHRSELSRVALAETHTAFAEDLTAGLWDAVRGPAAAFPVIA